jgi:sec-independent protein translocase protein TatB
MFGIGPMELAVLAIVGLIVLGPERLPGFARQAAQMIRTLRDMATGAREQLRDELGPEFADVDLRNLNPRTAVRRVLFDDEFDIEDLNPRRRLRDAVLGDEDLQAVDPRRVLREPASTNGSSRGSRARREAGGGGAGGSGAGGRDSGGGDSGGGVRMTKQVSDGLGVPPSVANGANGASRPRPRPSPRPRASYDEDAT